MWIKADLVFAGAQKGFLPLFMTLDADALYRLALSRKGALRLAVSKRNGLSFSADL